MTDHVTSHDITILFFVWGGLDTFKRGCNINIFEGQVVRSKSTK